ncbi:MAG TPA: transglycosylase SLT domain-containing protein [Beijerinckiaceae bacterium]|nr:transglycosylase SLT domain-containing protein [Beijerinckiaceae bacterium]
MGRDANETLVFGPMKVSRWLAETVVRAAETTGVDPAYLMALADKESSLLPASKAETSSAEGLFQFLESTWLEVLRRYGDKHGFKAAAEAIGRVQGRTVVTDETQRAWILSLRRDPYLSAVMAGEMVNAHREILAGKAERDPSFSELYMAHFLGVHGASRFLELLQNKPTATATKEFPKAAKANRAIFTEAKGKKPKNLTMAEVQGRIDAMIDYRVARYEAVRGDLARVAAN